MAMPSPSPRRGLTFVFPAFAAALLLAGCASTGGLAPREHPIEADSLASGRSLEVPALSDAPSPARAWWTAIGDPPPAPLVRDARKSVVYGKRVYLRVTLGVTLILINKTRP